MDAEVRAEIRESRVKDVRLALVIAHGLMLKASYVRVQAAVMHSSTDYGRLDGS